MIEEFFKKFEEFLDEQPGFQRSFTKSIGDIEKTRPWRETVWRHPLLNIIHWENVVTPAVMSISSPRHVWKLGFTGVDAVFSVHFGRAPYESETKNTNDTDK